MKETLYVFGRMSIESKALQPDGSVSEVFTEVGAAGIETSIVTVSPPGSAAADFFRFCDGSWIADPEEPTEAERA